MGGTKELQQTYSYRTYQHPGMHFLNDEIGNDQRNKHSTTSCEQLSII